MKLTHLGESPDHWKGSLRELLSAQLKSLYVVPMITDRRSWQPRHFETYAQLLRVGVADIFQDCYPSSTYFEVAVKGQEERDLFVDPNTGIRDIPATNPQKMNNYILVSECSKLLPSNSPRVLMIYEQSRNNQDEKSDHIDDIGQRIKIAGCEWCAYDGGTNLTMFLLSRSKDRITEIRARISAILNLCAEGAHAPSGLNRLFP